MATFERDINCLADKDRMKRKNGLKRLLDAVRQPEAGEWEAAKLRQLTTEALRRLEDTSESCREMAIQIVQHATPLQGTDVLDYVLPSVTARIGVEPVREESEELRLKLLELALTCLEHFRNDLGPYIDYYPVVLENCVKDEYPDLKKRACQVIVRLCEVEPKRVKSATVPLAKAVKLHGLNHKHAVVRCEAIKCFGVLIAHGAAELLGDMKDELDNRTTVYALYQLANDRADSVRRATIEVLSLILLDITERAEQPRRVLPFVLSLLSDPVEENREAARVLLHRLGKLYQVDNEDNRVDLSKRRITIKDIEWYADDEMPDMTLTTKSTADFPDLARRPSLGARHAVSEHVRNFLDKLLEDATSVNWMIPHSMWNRRVVALRTLAMAIVYCENNVVQYAQQILQALYKVVRDEDKEVATEGLVCAELLGKFMSIDQYLPFLVAKSDDEEDGSRIKTKDRTITVLNADGTPAVGSNKMPTLFSTAGNVTKSAILTVMRLLLLGSRLTLTAEQAKLVVKALCDPSLQNLEAPELAKNLIAVQLATAEMLTERGFVVANVAPEAARTLDSMLMYSVLSATAAEDASVVAAADDALATFSAGLFDGDKNFIYQQHFGRWIKRHVKEMPPEALQRLITNTPDLTPHAQFITDLFFARLGKIDFRMRVTAEIALYSIMKQVLDSERLRFTLDQLELLLREVVMVHLKFQPGPTAAIFRKLAFGALRCILKPFHREVLQPALERDDGALGDKVASAWVNGVDSDDAEMRLQCVECAHDVCQVRMEMGTGAELVDHLISGLNDSSDHLRYTLACQLRAIVYNGSTIVPPIAIAVNAKLSTMTQTLLIHMDDHEDSLGIREQICLVIKRLKGINRDLVHDMVAQARGKHMTPRYCDEILNFEAK